MRVALFVVLMFCFSGCMAPGDLRDSIDKYYEKTIASVQSLKDGVDAGIDAVQAQREQNGEDQGASLDWKDWAIIIASIAGAGLGINTARDRKYVRASTGGNGPGARS